MTKHPELRFMQAAIDLSAEAVRDDAGGPFGAVVVRDAEVVGRGRNRVLADKDPSAHAEIVAIREACRNLGDHRLAGCVVYTSSEPCPMCMAALYWARVEHVYFANLRADAAAIGFDDEWLYRELGLAHEARSLEMSQLMRDEAKAVFDRWNARPDAIIY
jgi:guanine deaminase